MLKALSNNFPDYEIWASDDSDILVVAKKSGAIPAPDPTVLRQAALSKELRRIDVNSYQDFMLHRVAGQKTLEPFISTFTLPANSDYYPIIDQNAARTRFLELNANEVVALADAPLPLIEILEGTKTQRDDTDVSSNPFLGRARGAFQAEEIRDLLVAGYPGIGISRDVLEAIDYLRLQPQHCDAIERSTFLLDHLLTLSIATLPYLTPEESGHMWKALSLEPCREHMTLTQQRWYDLLQAVGQRDAGAMATLGETVLRGERPENLERYGYALLAAMCGDLADGKPRAAQRLWAAYSPAIYGRSQLDTLLLFVAAQGVAAND
jgi:spermidine synthase